MPKLTINDMEIEVEAGTSILQAAEQLGIEVPRFCYHDKLSVPANCRMCLVEVSPGPPKPQASCALAPLVGTIMTRCINCTRCVRFAEEIAGTPVLGQFNRGEDAEIGTFVDELVDTELSGNLIDICPVGALTSKPYKYKARSWELKKTETIDVHDALGCNIRVDSRGREVMRILPRLNEDINEEWIDDRTRFSYDGLAKGRIDRPYIRDEENGKLIEASWSEAFDMIRSKLSDMKGEEIAAVAGDLVDVEGMTAMKDLMASLGSPNMDCRTDGTLFNAENRSSYLFNSTLAAIDEADAILLVGTNPRHEATLVNARIRKNWLEKQIPISVIGEKVDLTYPYFHAGTKPQDLVKMAKEFAGKVKAEKPMMIVGSGVFAREDGLQIQAMIHKAAEDLGVIKKDWNGFNVLQNSASRVGALDIGFLPQKGGQDFANIMKGTKDGSIKALFLLGADEFNARVNIGWQTFVVYQGHHGDHGAERADVVLPSAAYTEKDGTYVNTEGRPQAAKRSVFPPGDAKEDWAILRALSEHIGKKPLPYNSQNELRARIQKEWTIFKSMNEIIPAKWDKVSAKGKVLSDPFVNPVRSYYLKNAICRASDTMRECTESFNKTEQFQEAAE